MADYNPNQFNGMDSERIEQALAAVKAQGSGKIVDGMEEYLLNQDGIDLRQGCHCITIENITGYTGDDLIALTTIGGGKTEAGADSSIMVAGTKPTDDDNISYIIIRDILGILQEDARSCVSSIPTAQKYTTSYLRMSSTNRLHQTAHTSPFESATGTLALAA